MSRADPPAVRCRARSPGSLDKVLLQLEAPVRVEIVLLVQPLDALAEAGHLGFGQEALRVLPPPPRSSPTTAPSAPPPAAAPPPVAPAAPSMLHDRGTFGGTFRAHSFKEGSWEY
jgi:hypothetical protein